MRFLVDSCAGRSLVTWLRSQGHDALDGDDLRPDPGDRALLELASDGDRILITIDMDFGRLIFAEGISHAGLVRLPDVPAQQRIDLMTDIIGRYSLHLEQHAIVTVRGNRIRITGMTTE